MTKKALGAGVLVAAVALLIAPGAVFAQLSSAYQNPIPGVTQPIRSNIAKRTPPMSGPVLEITVKPGDAVKKGQLLIRQDDRAELAKLEGLELEANSTAKIDEAKANLDVKESVLKRKEKTFSEHALSPAELEEARLEKIDAEARLKVAQLDVAKARTDVKYQKVKIDQMRIVADFDGHVESLDTNVGEITDPTKPMITIVQTNPLWVEVRNMPTVWAGRLKVGDKVEVRYDDRYAGTPIYDQKWVQAEVIFKQQLADERSDTQLVTVSMPNPNHLDAGLQVVVKLPDSVVNPAASPAAAARP
jgi:RND family efflux transporter MFP subunit